MKVYAIINTVNGKMYIGKTSKSVSIRFTAHIKNAQKKINRHLYDAMNHYRFSNFITVTLHSCETNEEANNVEKLLIKEYNTLSLEGYNMTEGGDGGYVLSSWSEEDRLNLWKRQADTRRGTPCKEETKLKISEGNKGKIISEETKKKMSIGSKASGKKPPRRVVYKEAHPMWAKIDIDYALLLCFAGETLKSIAKEFSCSYTTVWTRLKDVTGLTYNDWRRYYD